jgi:anthranilate synthase/aminodeoxychorismate synthase-like glutamine amidotransferase
MSPRDVLLVDNYDSFTHNIAHALASLGASVDVRAVDDPCLTWNGVGSYDAVILGPGPGAPRQGDRLAQAVARTVQAGLPLLGICLGMQAIARHYGARIVRAPFPVHGEVAIVDHDGSGLFGGVPSPLRGMRYHSLCVAAETLPATMRATAISEDGVIQGIESRDRPVYGLQFHPESFLSEHGGALLWNFLASSKATTRAG